MRLLAGKIAVFPSGAGGIGAVICDRLTQDGAKIVVHYGGRADAAENVIAQIK